MAYSTGLLRHRIEVQNRTTATMGRFGRQEPVWVSNGSLWADVSYVKGVSAMREGAIDVYGVVMVRCRYNILIDVRSRIVYEGQTYQILGETLHQDKQENTCQFHAQIIINNQGQNPSSSELGPTGLTNEI